MQEEESWKLQELWEESMIWVDPGYYSLVSGYLEEEETPLDGIIRELKEEFENKKSQKVHFSSCLLYTSRCV